MLKRVSLARWDTIHCQKSLSTRSSFVSVSVNKRHLEKEMVCLLLEDSKASLRLSESKVTNAKTCCTASIRVIRLSTRRIHSSNHRHSLLGSRLLQSFPCFRRQIIVERVAFLEEASHLLGNHSVPRDTFVSFPNPSTSHSRVRRTKVLPRESIRVEDPASLVGT